jgi:penicillin-binding protein 1A
LTADIAGKTGTTQNNSDGWFMGATPELLAGSWVGCEDRFIRFRSTAYGQGASTALPIWAKFFQKIYADTASFSDFSITNTFEKPEKMSIELDCGAFEREINEELNDFTSEGEYGDLKEEEDDSTVE